MNLRIYLVINTGLARKVKIVGASLVACSAVSAEVSEKSDVDPK